jgi:ribosome maturation protein SDO1
MAQVTARIKAKGKHFEILVDLEEALKVQKGQGDLNSAVMSKEVYHELSKGSKVSSADMMDAFGTTDFNEICKKIIEKGEVQKNQDFRDAEREARIKLVVSLILRNCVDQNGRPYTEDRIKRAIEEAKVPIDDRPAEQQMIHIVETLKKVIPIRVEIKRVKLTIPAQYTGQVYGILKDFKDGEEWLANGSLQVTLSIPSGMQIDFYDKLNNITHGAIQSEDIVEKK